MLKFIIDRLFGSVFDRALSSVDKYMESDVRKDEIKAAIIKSQLEAQTQVLTGKGWWFPLFFIAPTALWYSSVCIYSSLFCAGCRFPQTWSIAALPPPLDMVVGVIVSGLFVGKGIETGVALWKKK
jgi:hypothetical protein